MTPDLLSALRETPGCGTHRVEEIGIGTMWCRDCGRQNPSESEPCWRHEFATNSAQVCDPCLTRLAEAVIEQVVARWPLDEVMMLRSYKPDIDTYEDVRRDVLASLLTALRSETPR